MRSALSVAPVLLALLGCSKAEGGLCVALGEGWTTPKAGQPVHLVSNTVGVRGREIRWNGVTISEQTLADYLRRTARAEPLAFIIFDPQGEDCAFATHVRDLINRNYPCRSGMCGQGMRRAFDAAPYRNMAGAPPA
jgi:hypothetical protein